MRLYTFICIIGALLLNTTKLGAEQPLAHAIKANIIYQFTKYIDWPGSKRSGDFIIGIVGETPVFNELKKIAANKRVGSQKIIIKKLSSSSDAFKCHILFLTDDENNNLKRIAAKTANSSVLIVSESDGLAKRESCINFNIIDDRMKLEINKNNIEERNLRIANELLKLAIIVK